MSRQTLRDLAKDYAKGVTDKDSYRKSRTELIQGIVAGNIKVKPIDFIEPLRPSSDADEDITEGRDRDWDTTQITSPGQSPSKPEPNPKPTPSVETEKTTTKGKSNHIFIIISIVFVLALIIAVVLFYPKPPEANTPQISRISTTTASNTSNVTSAAEVLIGKFLNEKNWNDKNLDKFVQSWTVLTLEERYAALETNRMQRLKGTIYDQFLKAKALSSIDAEKAISKQQKLIEFANAIGIKDSRLVIDN